MKKAAIYKEILGAAAVVLLFALYGWLLYGGILSSSLLKLMGVVVILAAFNAINLYLRIKEGSSLIFTRICYGTLAAVMAGAVIMRLL